MARYIQNVVCAEKGCNDTSFYEFPNLAERRDFAIRQQKSPYRCWRHNKPSDVLSVAEPQKKTVLVATRRKGIPNKLFWVNEDGTKDGSSGFRYGPGFKADANDFPEGTRMVVTAEIELPSS